MQDFSKARVGDKVWSKIHGEGHVTKVAGCFLLSVGGFRDGIEREYLLDGRFEVDDLFPELLWGPVEFDDPPPPKRKVKKVIDGWIGVSTGGPRSIRGTAWNTSCFYNYERDYDQLIGRMHGFIKIHVHHEYEEEE